MHSISRVRAVRFRRSLEYVLSITDLSADFVNPL